MPRHLSVSRHLIIASLLLALQVQLHANPQWARYRGPNGAGHVADKSLPTKWTAKSVVWRTALPGEGQSSPVVWDNSVFVTSAVKKGKQVERIVICLDRKSGEILWQKKTPSRPAERVHKMNSYAAASCATDGGLVVAFFGQGGIYCYDMKGNELWSHDLGKFPGMWGTAASPIILGDKVIQNCDCAKPGKSYLLALDKKTGKTVWKADRPQMPRGGWSTPILIDTGKRKELALHGEFGVRGYDPDSGKELWFCKSFIGRGSPAPVYGHKLLFLVCGKKGDTYAVRPGGSGDVTKTHMAWHTPRPKGRNVGAPILVDNYLLYASLEGYADCNEATTGKLLWNARLPTKCSASPLFANGLVYFFGEEGNAVVIKPGSKLEIVAKNTLGTPKGEIFRGTPAPVQGQFIHRSNKAIYCIGK